MLDIISGFISFFILLTGLQLLLSTIVGEMLHVFSHRTAPPRRTTLHIIILYAQNICTRSLRLFFLSFYIMRFFFLFPSSSITIIIVICARSIQGDPQSTFSPFFHLLMRSCSISDFWIFRRPCFRILDIFRHCSRSFPWRYKLLYLFQTKLPFFLL